MRPNPASLLLACALMSSLGACGDSNQPVYAMVTHGLIISSFWQSVYSGTQDAATRNNVKVVVFSPAIETSGPLLNAKMQEALDLQPPPAGIIGTIWGEGMVDKVRAANAAKIPIVAFNVYPDSAQYVGNSADLPADPKKGGLLAYSGDDNAEDAKKTLMSMIQYATDGTKWKGDDRQPPSCSSNWAKCLTSLGLKQVVLANIEPTGGQLDRIAGATKFMTDIGQQNLLYTLDVSQARVEDREAALDAYFKTLAPTDKVFLVCLADRVVEAYSLLRMNWSQAQKDQVKVAASFDLSQVVQSAVRNGDLAFGVDIGQTVQGGMALEVLLKYQRLGRQPTTQEVDGRWYPDLSPFPWYKTGPNFIYAEDLK